VPIALTHATLGRLIGARRPTVSLALKDLASRGLLERRSDGAWILSHAARGILHTGGEVPRTTRPSFLATSDDHAHAAPTAVPRTLRPMDLALLHSRLVDLRRNHARSVETVAASLDRSHALCEQVRRSRELRSRCPPGAAP
jgi:Crp-like helix-turn-helix protein